MVRKHPEPRIHWFDAANEKSRPCKCDACNNISKPQHGRKEQFITKQEILNKITENNNYISWYHGTNSYNGARWALSALEDEYYYNEFIKKEQENKELIKMINKINN